MTFRRTLRGALALLAALPAPAAAAQALDFKEEARDSSEPYLQCVPYAREVSGIQIYGDAWTWWDQAAGRYERGERPRVGAVLAFMPHGSMRLGHVAAVSRVIDSRTVLLRHANWSPIDGRRGRIEDDVRAVDVSPGNDWSEVRVWYAPIGDLGTTRWPVHGFIYNRPENRLDRGVKLARSSRQPVRDVAAATRPQASTGGDPIGAIIAARSNRTLAMSDRRQLLD